jgi:hypothetical protein
MDSLVGGSSSPLLYNPIFPTATRLVWWSTALSSREAVIGGSSGALVRSPTHVSLGLGYQSGSGRLLCVEHVSDTTWKDPVGVDGSKGAPRSDTMV